MVATERITNFQFWCQKVLPAVYDDSLSYYELLCKVVDYLNKVIDELNTQGDAITELQENVAALDLAFAEFKEHGFDDYYAAQVERWVAQNLDAVLKAFVKKQVFFGLTSDGYFTAYIPDAWSDIIFDTGMVYGRSDYGRLILRFDADGAGVIDNTYSYSLSNADAKALGDIEMLTQDMAGVRKTLYTPLDKEV